MTSAARVCAHAPCDCLVRDEGLHCSDRCRAAAGEASAAGSCDCGHAACTRSKTPADAAVELTPETRHATPEALLGDGRVPTGRKVEILRSWAYDAREQMVAAEEGMGRADEGAADRLARIQRALRALGADEQERAGPAKS